MTEICEYNKCTGCQACVNICAHKAITMKEDGPLGFIHPAINNSLCVDCGLCVKTCPVNNPINLSKPFEAYACVCKSSEDTYNSASGGAAYSIAKAFIENGGIVYGCEMHNYKHISHERYSTVIEMQRMRGSKYVQSDIGLIYKSVKKDLLDGLKVLFTGTPCQIGGLKAFLRKEYENLYTLDLVCHGVPSRKLLQDDIDALGKKYKVKVPDSSKVSFRKKVSKQEDPIEVKFGTFIESDLPIHAQNFLEDDYITAFMHSLTFRDNCYECTYARRERVSDITVADFWGLGRDSRVQQGFGVSLVLLSSDKGLYLYSLTLPCIDSEQRPLDEAISGNGQLNHPSIKPAWRDDFVLSYAANGVKAYTKYLKEYRKSYRRMLTQRKRYAIARKYRGACRILNLYYRILNKIDPTIKAI